MKAIKLALCAAAMGVATANAEDYMVEAGELATMSLSGGTTNTYDAVTVAGDLTVTGDGWVQMPKLSLAGGTLTVDGAKTSFGRIANSGLNTTNVVTFTDGAYGKVVVTNGTGTGPVDLSVNRYNFSTRYFDVVAAANATGDGGYIDVLSLADGCAAIREFRNCSTLTARVSVAGTAYLTKGNEYAGGAGIFCEGPAAIVLKDGSGLTVNAGQQGSLNDANVPVTVFGDGDLTLRCSFVTDNGDYPMCVRKGALIDNAGKLTLRCNTGTGIFQFYDGVVGPNVTNVTVVGTQWTKVILRVAADSTVTVKALDFVRANYADCLAGDAATSVVRIDATDAPRTFRANMPPQYSYTVRSATKTISNFITVEKVGGHEATISATTNIPSLKVLEGVVRITSDCVISNLSGAVGATLVVDGCRVSITGEAALHGLSLATVNGGEIGGDRIVAYEPGVITGALHVASGSLVFSQWGLAQKFWRFTFTSVKGGPDTLHLRGLYLFAGDGTWQNEGLAYATTANPANENTTTVLDPGETRWYCSSATNVASAATTESWRDYKALQNIFTYSGNGNHDPHMSSPVIDPENPDSHLAIEMRLVDSAKPITGYNLRESGSYAQRYADSWRIEVSDDGRAWTTIVEREDQTSSLPGWGYTYDGLSAYVKNTPNAKEFFHFTGYTRNGLAPLAEPLALQVDEGAEIDLRAFTDGQAINALMIDLSAGGGTIHGGTLASGGTLTLVNADGYDLSQTLPLTFDGTADMANVATWSVVIDGKAKRRKATIENGALRLLPPGMVIMVK